MIVQVYTSDDKLYLYEIREYRLHAVGAAALDAAIGATTEQLWLQTSEGPKGTPGKTQLRAFPISVSDADPGRCRAQAAARLVLRLIVDPVDPPQGDGGERRPGQHEAGHQPEPAALAVCERHAAPRSSRRCRPRPRSRRGSR